jgi:DNA-3-methyladenine glycosylase II
MTNSSASWDSSERPLNLGFDPESVNAAIAHLRRRDGVLRGVIQAVGPFRLKLGRDRFQTLVKSIISQQISGKAARSIQKRLVTLVGPGRFTPERLAELSLAELRSAGVSPQKGGYLHDLAVKVASGEVRLARLGRLPDEDVIAQLTRVRGIGVWTAQMFLMFSLGRPDVFPHEDLGIRTALKRLYGLNDLPDCETSHDIARPWRPYATIASWYCWRSLEPKTPPSPG